MSTFPGEPHYYFEWTSGPSHASNYRQDFYGWTLLAPEEGDPSPDALTRHGFMDTWLPATEKSEPLADPNALQEWIASKRGRALRRELTVNTVGFQGTDVESLSTFPAALDYEVWPYLD